MALFVSAFVIIMISGCASGPASGNVTKNIRFTIKVSDAGEIDTSGRGYYVLLLNSLSEPIEVTNFETFTDFVRYDGINFTWYHRQGNVPSPGYTWVNAGNINSSASIAGGGKSIVLRMNVQDSSFIFNQYMQSARFTCHVLTTDSSNSLIGRALDTLGQGPSISGNSLYTVGFDKNTGIMDPLPPGYPSDPIGDVDEKPDLEGFPYDSYDIDSFTVDFE